MSSQDYRLKHLRLILSFVLAIVGVVALVVLALKAPSALADILKYAAGVLSALGIQNLFSKKPA